MLERKNKAIKQETGRKAKKKVLSDKTTKISTHRATHIIHLPSPFLTWAWRRSSHRWQRRPSCRHGDESDQESGQERIWPGVWSCLVAEGDEGARLEEEEEEEEDDTESTMGWREWEEIGSGEGSMEMSEEEKEGEEDATEKGREVVEPGGTVEDGVHDTEGNVDDEEGVTEGEDFV